MTNRLRQFIAAVALVLPSLAFAQVANIPGVYLNGTPPTGFGNQSFKMDCNNATPTSGQCWPLIEIYDAAGNQATVNSSDHGLTVHVANTNNNGQSTMSGSSPVVIASDQSAVAVKAASVAFVAGSIADLAHGQGTMAASVPVAMASDQSPMATLPQASAAGGGSQTGNIVVNNTTAVVVKGSAGTLYSLQLAGLGAAPAFLKIYDATAATCGSGTPKARYMIPAAATAANGAGSNIDLGPVGVAYATGITYCVTTGITDADTTAPSASTFLVNLVYK